MPEFDFDVNESVIETSPTALPEHLRVFHGARYEIKRIAQQDSGPYYFYAPGEIVCLHGIKVLSEKYLNEGRKWLCGGETLDFGNTFEWVDRRCVDQMPPDALTRVTRNPLTGEVVFEEVMWPIFASAIRDTLVEQFGNTRAPYSYVALTQITAFNKQSPHSIHLEQFKKAVAPTLLDEQTPYGVPSEFREEAQKSGILAVRRKMLERAGEFFARSEFAAKAASLQPMYLHAVEEMLRANSVYEQFASRYLDENEKAIEEKDRKGYDDRMEAMLRLLGRAKQTEAVSRALTDRNISVTVQQPPPSDHSDALRRPCPECGEMIVAAARICRFCHTRFNEDAPVNATPVQAGARARESAATTPARPPVQVKDDIKDETVEFGKVTGDAPKSKK